MATNHQTEEDRLVDGPAHPGRLLTEEEFVEWCVDSTWAEWVDGEVIMMSPVSRRHALLAQFLSKVLGIFIDRHRLGSLLGEPFQVRLDSGRRRSPDLFFVANDRQMLIKETYFDGAPDLVIEIVSPESKTRDLREKYRDYQTAGVREYWIIDPLVLQFEINRLEKTKYIAVAESEGIVASSVLPGFYIRPDWLWSEPLPDARSVLMELGAWT